MPLSLNDQSKIDISHFQSQLKAIDSFWHDAKLLSFNERNELRQKTKLVIANPILTGFFRPITNGLGSIAGLVLFIMCLLPTKEATEKADAPTETFVNSDATSDAKSSKEIDASQIDPNSKENAED